MENIGVGLMLMVVGMATVFVILLIVIYLSKYLITVVNKVAPEETPKKAPAVAPTADTGAMDEVIIQKKKNTFIKNGKRSKI